MDNTFKKKFHFLPLKHHIHGYCVHMGTRVVYFKRVWLDFSLLRRDEVSHAAHAYTNIPTVVNTDAHACATPRRTL